MKKRIGVLTSGFLATVTLLGLVRCDDTITRTKQNQREHFIGQDQLKNQPTPRNCGLSCISARGWIRSMLEKGEPPVQLRYRKTDEAV